MEKYKISKFLSGWNWGTVRTEENNFIFSTQGKELFTFTGNQISNLSNPNKNEMGIEFIPEENTEEDTLCEIRFYVPNKVIEDEEKEEVIDTFNAEILRNQVNKIYSHSNLGESIAVLKEIQMLIPRSKINVHFLKNILKLSGPSYDFKIQYSNIYKSFILPKQDGVHIAFVVSLKQPIRQGNTNYHFVVFQFKTGITQEISLNLPDDGTKYNLPNVLNDNVYDIMANLFKNIIGISVLSTGKFKSAQNIASIKCTIKANEGYFYPLDKYLIFIPKPTILIKLEELQSVSFERLSESSQRFFELKLNKKKGEQIIFNNIERKEYPFIKKYFEEKNIQLITDEDENGDDKIITKKVRKAPEVDIDKMELPSEEDEYDESYNDE